MTAAHSTTTPSQPRESSPSSRLHLRNNNDSPLDNIIVARVNSHPKHGAPAVVAGHRHADDERPAKKRKLSIRTHSSNPIKHQTTLLHHFAPQHQSLKPPSTRVNLQEPHGQLVQTINRVQTALDAGEDDLLLPSPKPQRTTRSPQPVAPPISQSQQRQQQKKNEDRRSLRSHDDGPRLKSELAVYFPNYEEIIFDVEREQEDEFLTVDTTLYITDDTVRPAKPDSPAKLAKSNPRRTSLNVIAAPPLTPQRTSSNRFNGSPTLNLDFVTKNISSDTEDPLTDAHFLKSHKRAERKEKQLRNIEKERAMHEKVQLERLLDGLLGHDWLRVLGITGVTDTEARKYESKRDYFIAEVQALVGKFKQWKEQEKKQRLGKEAMSVVREAEEEDGNTTEGSVEPPSSDLNASAAKQLQQETANAVRSASASNKQSGKGKDRSLLTSHPSLPGTPTFSQRQMLPPQPPSPELPFVSFYAKRHLRDAAMAKTRHGRNVTAFGQPLPEMDEYEFRLPDDYVTEDALRANARERRRRKRESTTNASSKGT